MRIRRRFLGWGVFLILAGAVPLLVRGGYLTDETVDRAWNLWPLILVGIGIGLVLRRTRLEFLGGLVVAATFGLMAGGLLSNGVVPLTSGVCGQAGGTVAFSARDGDLPAGTSSVDLRLDCGTMTVAMTPGTAWQVAGRDADATGPDIEASDGSLSVRSRRSPGSFLDFGKRETWQVSLPSTPRLDLDLRLDAGSATVDLAGARLGKLGLELNAGSATVDLSSVASIADLGVGLNAGSLGLTLPNVSMSGSIEANAGAIKLCAPPGAALKLHIGENIIGSYAYGGHGLVKEGSTWTTPGFDTAAVRIEIQTVANAGSFTLDPADGCE